MRQAIEAQRRQAPHPAVPSAPNTQMPQTRSGAIYNTQYGMASQTGHLPAFGNMSPTTSAGAPSTPNGFNNPFGHVASQNPLMLSAHPFGNNASISTGNPFSQTPGFPAGAGPSSTGFNGQQGFSTPLPFSLATPIHMNPPGQLPTRMSHGLSNLEQLLAVSGPLPGFQPVTPTLERQGDNGAGVFG